MYQEKRARNPLNLLSIDPLSNKIFFLKNFLQCRCESIQLQLKNIQIALKKHKLIFSRKSIIINKYIILFDRKIECVVKLSIF